MQKRYETKIVIFWPIASGHNLNAQAYGEQWEELAGK